MVVMSYLSRMLSYSKMNKVIFRKTKSTVTNSDKTKNNPKDEDNLESKL